MTTPFGFARDRIQTSAGYVVAVAGPTLLALAVTVIAMVVDQATGGSMEDILVSGVVFMCLTVSLQVLMGNTGLIFFGQFAFVAVGAYVSGVLTVPASRRDTLLPELPSWLANVELNFGTSVLVGALAGAAVAAIASPVLVRVSGLAAAVVSLGLLFIVSDLLRETPSITRGDMVFAGVPYDTTLGSLQVGLRRHVVDRVVHEHRIEGATEAHLPHVAFEVFALRVDRSGRGEHCR